MSGYKKWWESKTVWANLVAAVLMLLAWAGFGVELDEVSQASVVNWLVAFAGVFANAIGVYSRIVAQKQITTSKQ